MFGKNFSVNGVYVVNHHKGDHDQPKKETVRLFYELEELLRNARVGKLFDEFLLSRTEMSDAIDTAFMTISRRGDWASLRAGGICSEGTSPESFSFAHVQMRDIRVFFVENPYEGKIYVIFSDSAKKRVGIITMTQPWRDCINFNKRNAVYYFYWDHYDNWKNYDNFSKNRAEVLRYIERKPWKMFRVYKDGIGKIVKERC